MPGVIAGRKPAMIHQALPRLSFTSGELSPWLYGRTDLDAVSRGAARLNNMLVSPVGGGERRRGTEWGARAGCHSGAVRLMTFAFSDGDQFIMELGRGYIRYYRNGHQLRDGDGHIYETPTPWVADEMLLGLRMQQLNDVIYFACPLVFPHVLARYGNLDWRLEPMAMKSRPLISMLDHHVRMKYAWDSSVSGARLRVETDADVFVPEMEGTEYVCITIPVNEQVVEGMTFSYPLAKSLNRYFYEGELFRMDLAEGQVGAFTCVKPFAPSLYTGSDNPESYPDYFINGVEAFFPLLAYNGWRVESFGTWDAHWIVEKSYAASPGVHRNEWISVKNMVQHDSKRQNYAVTGEETTETWIRVLLHQWKSGSSHGLVEARASAGEHKNWLKVVKVGDSRTAWLEVIGSVNMGLASSGSTYKWSFGAFGVANGYPACVDFHQGRLWFASTSGQPQTVWASAVDDLDRFFPGAEADSPLTLTLAASQQNRICWMASLRGLVLGTSEGEWMLRSSDGNPICATNAEFVKQSGIGSDCCEPLTVENSLFFLQKGRGKVREFSYALEADGFVSTDIGLLAEHLLGIGVVDWAAQQSVSLRIWCVLKDGTVACLTVNKTQNVAAWQRHEIAGAFVMAVAATKTDRDWKDEVWFLTKRQVNGEYVYGLERMAETGFYLDACSTISGGTGMAEGLDRFAGNDVLAHPVQDDARLFSLPVSREGKAVIPDDADGELVVGLAFESGVTSMPLETAEIMGFHKTNVKSRILLKESGLSFEYSGSGDEGGWQRFMPDRFGITAPYSGYVDTTHFSGGRKQPQLSIRSIGAQALNILALVPELSVVNG